MGNRFDGYRAASRFTSKMDGRSLVSANGTPVSRWAILNDSSLARQEGFIDAVCDYCTIAGAFRRWLSYADRQAALF